jgi:hypothetical protein
MGEAPSRPDATAAVTRGAMRLLSGLGMAPLAEVTLGSGRRLDLLALAADGGFWAIEVKSGLDDFRVDLKWREYPAWADAFLFAVPVDFPLAALPAGEGLIVADRYGAELMRPPRVRPLAPARRRALLLRFARLAAARAHGLADPDAVLDLPGR